MMSYILDKIKCLAYKFNYPMDGAVISFNDIKYGEMLGQTQHHPLHSIAYKYKDKCVDSIVLDVVWSMGKTGVLTPTCIFKPVECEGTTISKASMHNLTVMSILHPTIGCTCHVYKANMIIPQIQRCDNNGSSEVVIPKNVLIVMLKRKFNNIKHSNKTKSPCIPYL